MLADHWQNLLALKTKLLLLQDKAADLRQLFDEEAIIEVYADDIEHAMFIVATNRLTLILRKVCPW